MPFDDLVFTPPTDLDAVASAVMERGRRRRHVRRTRAVVVGAAFVVMAAVIPIAVSTSSDERAPVGGTPGVDPAQVAAGSDDRERVGNPALEDGASRQRPASTSERGQTTTAPTTPAEGVAVEPASTSSGDLVAFVSAGGSQLNDIFLYDAAKGTTTALTTSPSVDSWPTWSPDRTRLAFYSDREGAANIYVMSIDGTDQRRITDVDAGYQATQPAWSPDGERIAFTLSRRPVAQASVTEVEDFDIWVIAPDGSGAHKLLDRAAQPAWSPDGRSLAFVAEDELKVVDLSTGDVRTVVTGFISVPAWSPDGSRITYQQSSDGRDQIYVVNADGTHPRKPFDSSSFDYAPSFSPDGTRLVFRHDTDGPERVYCEDFDPAPSGCRGPGAAPGQLWVVDLEGGVAGPLIDGRVGDDFLPRFAPRPLTDVGPLR